jgi:predicted RND superfamily exporter protein
MAFPAATSSRPISADARRARAVRQNVIKSGKIGQLVANDFTGAIVSAQLLEVDPTTGKKLDYLRVAKALEALRARVERESNGGAVRVHIIGFAKVMGAVGDGARGVLTLFGLSIIITTLLVWYYAGRWKLAGAPVLCSFIAVVWQLGCSPRSVTASIRCRFWCRSSSSPSA